jgi:hypothetical protein
MKIGSYAKKCTFFSFVKTSWTIKKFKIQTLNIIMERNSVSAKQKKMGLVLKI